MINEISLKLCQFCGGVAETGKGLDPSDNNFYWWIQCTEGGATCVDCDSSEKLFRFWNTRQSDKIEIELCQLKAMLPDHAGRGDTEGQAKAWSAVWQALCEVGLLSFIGSLEDSGLQRAVKFIRRIGENRK